MQTFTGKQYMAIDIANQFGLDKLTWDERLDWFDRHEKYLEQLVGEADDIMLYRKGVRTWRKVQRGEPTGFIMGLDATGSGPQIMCGLSGDVIGGANMNMVNTGKREDFYTKIANTMNRDYGTNVTRAEIKHPIMTVFYGSTAMPKSLFGEDTPELKAFYGTLAKELPGPLRVLGAIQACWNPMGLNHRWVMPDGHQVVVKVMVPVVKKIEIDELSHATFSHQTYVNQPEEFGLSLAANVVHSIDGYIVREMIRMSHTQGFEMVSIHDSFWSHPNFMQQVRENYAVIMYRLARSTILQNILRQITGSHRVFEKEEGDLANEIIMSEYMLS